jgi:lipopolysaccharide export system protein LptC
VRHRALIVALLVVLGCGKGLPPNPGAPVPPNPLSGAPAAPDEARPTMEAQGVDLRLFDSHPTDGVARKPTFWVHAEVFSLAEENIWSFERARAVIYGREESAPEVTVEARRGRFQESKMAYLKDGVVAHIGEMKIEMTDIEWLNDERLGRTDNPLSITTKDSHLKASSLRLYPDRKELVLTEVAGSMRFERNEP